VILVDKPKTQDWNRQLVIVGPDGSPAKAVFVVRRRPLGFAVEEETLLSALDADAQTRLSSGTPLQMVLPTDYTPQFGPGGRWKDELLAGTRRTVAHFLNSSIARKEMIGARTVHVTISNFDRSYCRWYAVLDVDDKPWYTLIVYMPEEESWFSANHYLHKELRTADMHSALLRNIRECLLAEYVLAP
jgi:hypothetical protein